MSAMSVPRFSMNTPARSAQVLIFQKMWMRCLKKQKLRFPKSALLSSRKLLLI